MNVSLTNEMNKWIIDKVKTGQYKSSSEVVRDGLRMLQNRDSQRQAMQEDLRHELLLGIKQLESGKSRKFDSEFIDQIKAAGKQKLEI